MKLAALSVDVDSVASHLEGYGFARPVDDGAAYRVAVPRALQLFGHAGVRATFFLIGEEAARHPEAVREIVRGGHEVASHSMTHRLPFSDLDDARTRLEVTDSRVLLGTLAGRPVAGFRAPSWDVSPALFAAVHDAGYRYDASSYPSILLPLLRRAIARRSAQGRVRTGSSLWTGVFGPTLPHRRAAGGARTLIEVPVCTAPWTRLPYYHTMRFVLPPLAFQGLRALAHTRRSPITYQFHAVDFLGVERDALDPRIARHPGMQLGVDVKLDLAAEAVTALARARRVVPVDEMVGALFGPIPNAAPLPPLETPA